MNVRLGKQETFAAAVILTILLVIVFWFAAVNPSKQQISKIKAQQEEIKKSIEDNELTLKRLAELRKESSKVEAETVRILSNLPSKPELASYMVIINEIATKAGVKIVSFKPSAPAQEGDYAKIPVSITAETQFNNVSTAGGSLIEFLYYLERLPRITRVESVNIVRQSDNDPKLVVTLNLATYSLMPTNVVQTTSESTQTGGGSATTQTAGQ